MPIRWSIIWVIFRREVRDQLRDRRTLFMIFVLPMLLYPILIFGAAQIQAAAETKQRIVVVVGAENLPPEPPLLEGGERFHRSLFDTDREAERLAVKLVPGRGNWLDPAFRERATRQGVADAVVSLPANLRRQIEQKLAPQIVVDYDSADERSQVTFDRVERVLSRWQKNLLSQRLAADAFPANYTEPIKVKKVDVATPAELGSSVWSRLFPFLLVIMSLTGAFYPAVDICAGEKERGTMETLLISPASRTEIVLGKFFTVMLASVMTALLNLGCMAVTGMRLAQQVSAATAAAPGTPAARRAVALIAPPSFETAFWIVLLLIPLAAFFSALCLSLAVLARSMKEGQYYMTPLYLVCLPLMFLSLAPEVELSLFYSLVPITGVALLLKSLIRGDYTTAGTYFLPVLVPTVIYGWVSLRWAVEQFQREDVLFREAERFDLRLWLRHLFRDKEPTPSGGEALLCFALMLSAAWYLTQYLDIGQGTSTAAMAAGQIAFVLTPPLAMGFILTSSPRRTLRLYWPRGKYLGLAIGLALALHPLVAELGYQVQRFFPMSRDLQETVGKLLSAHHNLPTALLLFALIPAVCEEMAFRGYILSGLQRGHTARTAIVLSALLFGFMHVLLSLFQQLFNATLLGLVLGLLAVRSRSILPGIVFHTINNGLLVAIGAWVATPAGRQAASWLYRDVDHNLYHGALVVVGLVVSLALLHLLRFDRWLPRRSKDKPVAEIA